MPNLEFDYNTQTYRSLIGQQPHVFHCHHYNLFLQQTLLDASYVDTKPILIGASAETAHTQLSQLFAEQAITAITDRKAYAEALYSFLGFGRVQLGKVSESGGVVNCPSSHYVSGFHANKTGGAAPQDFFTQGWIAGAAAAIFDAEPGSYSSSVVTANNSETQIQFQLKQEKPNYAVYKASGPGPIKSVTGPADEVTGNIDRVGIRDAVLTLELVGDAEGLIPKFGVHLTRHYANYYNRISFEFLREMRKQFGEQGYLSARELLCEAGRICAFFTMGGVMQSTEWEALVRPQTQSKEDWLWGMFASLDAFGWGRYSVEKLSSDESIILVENDYEAMGYVDLYGVEDLHCSFLFEGGMGGLLTLVYETGIHNPLSLTPALYDEKFHNTKIYDAEILNTQARGDSKTMIRFSRIS